MAMTVSELPTQKLFIGGRLVENGAAALEHYTQVKSVYVELGDVACPYR